MAHASSPTRRTLDPQALTAAQELERKRLRALARARSVQRRRRREAERRHRRVQRQRLRELASQIDQAERDYDVAYRRAIQLSERQRWDEKEAKAWDEVAAIRQRIHSLRVEERHVREDLGVKA